jgi:hypothetical protein
MPLVLTIEGISKMSLNEPQRKHQTDYPQRLLERLQRELTERGRKTSSFSQLCDMASIPRDLRAALLKSLVGKGYLKAESGDHVSITPAGARQATSPLA